MPGVAAKSRVGSDVAAESRAESGATAGGRAGGGIAASSRVWCGATAGGGQRPATSNSPALTAICRRRCPIPAMMRPRPFRAVDGRLASAPKRGHAAPMPRPAPCP